MTEQANPLTRREKEIIEQLSFGYSAKQISDILFISELTVAKHKSNLFMKLNVNNTPHLVSMALREGLIC
ncbi:helix-turn-helix transcriptional regulator [Imperialibacter roseus]|uniref:Helix-turn-helix transcriptional regulator n=1 Tax=Imperialibacter roseus TaxID=1324217 RepID=A0ABZ0ISR2_9BACT|nr:helix-turn-helix transcriptional regulator [Imperialibacter roseus]WOK08088.1 helix-turn-helix transcriptional regulator [Imperialibacter roseus]|tara:strand:- start:28126 stop:28335 length:210 start_codon:yes stop_codon:yes gene_type:complete